MEDEKELRAIYINNIAGLLHYNESGLYHFEIEPEKLIENIIIGPYTDKAILETVNKIIAGHNINIKYSTYLDNITWKIHPILECYNTILTQYANPKCVHCNGTGSIPKKPYGGINDRYRFCTTCEIANQWESILKEELINLITKA